MTEEAKIKYDDIQLKMQEFEEEMLSVFEERDKKTFQRLLNQLLEGHQEEL